MIDSLRPSASAALIEAAFTLLSENPAASLADIAERAGVGRATLHRHFSGRDDLILTLGKTALREMEDAAETACTDVLSHSEALRRTLEALIPLGDRYRFLMREQIEEHPEILAELERQQREMRDMINEAKAEGLFDTAVPTAWIAQAYDNLLYAAWEAVKAQDLTPTQASTLAWQTLTKGLGAKP
ncbi:TetR/AcrR family transcriptional regulator [Alterisphingorhabdus coralli]|uniref:Helix-turn-helix domain-containing protein n=1 Tax=Alterisphingorhabdus coralli TaxID=3071408 RepID=A0AA97F9C0_9SPHN|nr:helix-turn-helix domain-containing protein [Parasphingorhabdus sp. SCSIO 66989]WOE76291.1 helix-turn-helix domain-containing protein [Parasphingorhabdus sp. SCSIO 66989]